MTHPQRPDEPVVVYRGGPNGRPSITHERPSVTRQRLERKAKAEQEQG